MLAVFDVVGDRDGGDDCYVLAGGVDEVTVAAADVAPQVGQSVDKDLGGHVEVGVRQGLVPAVVPVSRAYQCVRLQDE